MSDHELEPGRPHYELDSSAQTDWDRPRPSGHDGVVADTDVDFDLPDLPPDGDDIEFADTTEPAVDPQQAAGHLVVSAEVPDPRRPITAHVTDSSDEQAATRPDATSPVLEAGTAQYFDHDEDEWVGDSYAGYGDPERPELRYVPAGALAVGRGTADPNTSDEPGPVLEASSEGCRVVTLWNSVTRETGLVHVGAENLGTTIGEDMIDKAIEAAPSLADPANSFTHVFGDVETSPVGEAAADWNERLAAHLRSKGLSPTVYSQGNGKDVYIDADNGNVDTYDADGHPLYSFEPRHETDEAEAGEPSALTTVYETEPAQYETSVQELVADIVPHSRALRQAEQSAVEVAELYQDALADPDAPTDQAGRAHLLGDFLGDGRAAVDILTTMIQRHHPVLNDLRSTEAGDAVIRELLGDKLSTVIGELDGRIESLSTQTDENADARGASLRARRTQLEDIVQRLATTTD